MKHRIARYSALVALMIITLIVGRPVLGAATEGQLPTTTPTATATASATQTQTATLPPSATAEPASTPQPTATATPGANARPDDCEKNNRREAACPIAVDTVNGPFTFIPEGDQDWYRADQGEPNGLQTSVVVRASGTLDLLVSISRDDGTPLAAFSSPAISTTLAADIGGPIIIRVENRAPDDPVGSSYNIEVRRTLPPAPTPPPAGAALPTLTPDIGENNWNPATAAPIAVGVVYDLNLTCPVSWGCAGGDHDYFAVPVKQGAMYLIATFDLGPGVDTVLDLFWGREDIPIASSDDYGKGMLSVIRWVAPSNGTAIVRVGPRNGGMQPIVADKESGFYRFAVAVAGTELEKQLSERINAQGYIPTPTARPAPTPGGGVPASTSPAGGAAPRPAPAVANDAPKGEAIVTAESTVLRDRPDQGAAAITTLPQESIVTLLGQVSGTYVRVQPKGGVIPGWVRGADLQILDRSTAAGSPSATPSGSAASTPTAQATAVTAAPIGQAAPQVSTLPTATSVVAPVAAQRIPLALTVVVLQSSNRVISDKDPPSTLKPISGLRVQLVNAFGDILTEAVTPPDGQVTLTRDVEQGTAVYVRIPAMSTQIAADPAKPTVTIKVPAAGGGK